METKRYVIKLMGFATNQEWMVVAQCSNKDNANDIYDKWVKTHGHDHYLTLEDTTREAPGFLLSPK